MDYFKVGMIHLIAYAERYKSGKFDPDPFSFPHLDRDKKETPRDKLIELWAYCANAEAKKRPEEFFNRVFGLLDKSVKPGVKRGKGKDNLEISGNMISTAYVPFVDEFLSKCVYRDEVYAPAEAEKLLPILETIDEMGDYAKQDARRHDTMIAVEAFQYRLRQLIKAMRMAKKFNIEFGMSY